ncbi:MAG: MFS transporter, partial [Haloarculaceae archaeon]
AGTAARFQPAGGCRLPTVSSPLAPGPQGRSGLGWGGAFATLAVGPAVGTVAMRRLRASPDAAKLAGGRG